MKGVTTTISFPLIYRDRDDLIFKTNVDVSYCDEESYSDDGEMEVEQEIFLNNEEEIDKDSINLSCNDSNKT
jgi:hypothetical protein